MEISELKKAVHKDLTVNKEKERLARVKENKKLRATLSLMLNKEDRRRRYMREYMKKARAEGRVKHWLEYLKDKNES